jgi:electron transfer flavoprotein alpha subunit
MLFQPKKERSLDFYLTSSILLCEFNRMNTNIIVIADQKDGEITPVTFELITAANVLRRLTDADIKIIMTGEEASEAARQLSEQTGIDILVIHPCSQTNPEEFIPNEFIFKNLPATLLNDLNPTYVCMAHNTSGLDVAPGLAVKINAACITGVEKIERTDDGIRFTRSVFNDRITAQMISSAGITVLTIQSGMFKPDFPVAGTAGKIVMVSLPLVTDGCHFIEYKSNKNDTGALDNAEIIVSAGNGIREKEDLDLIYQLARLFPKSAVTGSRPICDKKWLKYSQQVGVTGATVKPKLYIACGISGASQHINGMRDSKFIVSINTDPHAAIFNISDVCIIEDLTTFIPELLNTHHARSPDT